MTLKRQFGISLASLTPTWVGKIPLASRKNDYPVYYQGDNLVETWATALGGVSSDSSGDTFALKGYGIRAPRVVRLIFCSESSTSPIQDYYTNQLGAYLTTMLNGKGVCVAWGMFSGATSGYSARWLAQATPGPETAEAVDPESGDHVAADKMLVGETLVFVFNGAFGIPYGALDPPPAIDAQYLADHTDYESKYGRHARLKVKVYWNEYETGAGETQANIAEYHLSALPARGVSLTRGNLENFISHGTFLTEVRNFFGIE